MELDGELFASFESDEGEFEAEDGNTGKYLTFFSDGLTFAMKAEHISQIIQNHAATHLPRVAKYVKGIMNLRGQIIPIVDYRLRSGRSEPEEGYGELACIIIMEVDLVVVGILVDGVNNVVDIRDEDIKPPPSGYRDHAFIMGIARAGEDVYLVLDCEKIIEN